MSVEIIHGDNLPVLQGFEDGRFNLIYIDPPFNTGRPQTRKRLKTVADESGDRVGFGGRRFRTEEVGSATFRDSFEDFLAFPLL